MKVIIIGLLVSANVLANTEFMHVPVELTLNESQSLMRKYISINRFKPLKSIIKDDHIRNAIEGGESLKKWIKLINSKRSSDKQVRLTDPSLRKGIPISNPKEYGPHTIKKSLNEIKELLPDSMLNIIYKNGSKTYNLPSDISKSDFIDLARKVNNLYQTAVRWQTVILPWKHYYKNAKARDIRGFYHLKKVEGLNKLLRNFKNLDQERQEFIKTNLLGICYNTEASNNKCQSLLNRSINQNNLIRFKNKFWIESQYIWDSFYKINNPRRDVDWSSSNASKMIVPFVNPNNSSIEGFLADNVEDEFKNAFWNLELDFITGNFSTARIKFKPGVTPHVRNGNLIVMDANTPIQEYEVQWTIRHEFGHILRLPDCYHEFYDEVKNVAVNYQLDTTDLMCSRAGDFNKRIYEELKRAYFKR